MKLLQQVDNLGLHGHVQRGDGLIRNEKIRVCDQCPGDGCTLPLPTGNVVRMTPCQFPRQAYLIHHFQNLFPHTLFSFQNPFARFFLLPEGFDGQGFCDDLLQGHAGIEGRCGILKDHLLPAALFKLDFPCFRAVDAHKAPCQGGLAAAGISYQPYDLSFIDVQAEILQHGSDLLLSQRKGFRQMADGNQRPTVALVGSPEGSIGRISQMAMVMTGSFSVSGVSQQLFRVIMAGIRKDPVGGSFFHDPAVLHNHDPVCQRFCQTQIMGHKEHGPVRILPDQRLKQLHNLILGRNVQ